MTLLNETSTEAFLATIRQRVAEAARMPGIAARHGAVLEVVPALNVQADEMVPQRCSGRTKAETCVREVLESFAAT